MLRACDIARREDRFRSQPFAAIRTCLPCGGVMPRGGTKGNRGGTGKARGPVVTGGREWLRSLADDPKRRKAFEKALDAQLKAGSGELFGKVFEGGYGRPPQALDVRTTAVGAGGQVIYRAAVQGLDSAEFEGLPGSDVSLGGTD
jgi:hypothetical protein